MSSPTPFVVLIERISKKDFPTDAELLPYLTLPSIQDRQEVNFQLANVYAQAEQYSKARALALRAAKIGPYRPDVFQLAINVLTFLSEFETAVVIARNAVVETARSRHENACYAALMTYYRVSGQLNELPDIIPEPYADPAIEMAIEQCFQKAPRPSFDHQEFGRRRLRIGYLLWGEANIQNVLVRNVMNLVRHHDYEVFDIGVYSYKTRAELLQDEPQFQKLIDEIEEYGATFREGVGSGDGLGRLKVTRDKFVADNLDVLVFSSQIYNYKLLAHFGCAPIQIGINQGNPRAYTSPQLDSSFVYTRHGQMESLCESNLVPSAIDPSTIVRRAPESGTLTAKDLCIPSGAVIIFTSGRDYKYNSAKFWALVESVLSQRPDAYWICAGVSEADVHRFGLTLNSKIRSQLKLLGWRNDVSSGLLPLAGIVVDTFPAGGGYSLYEGMLLSKPCLSFDSNYYREFTNRDWSPAFEPFQSDDLSVAYGDIDDMENRIIKLIDSPEERKTLGLMCRGAVEQVLDCSRLTKDVEHIYTAAVASHLNGQGGDVA